MTDDERANLRRRAEDGHLSVWEAEIILDLLDEGDAGRERLRLLSETYEALDARYWVLTRAARALADEVDAIPIQPANGVRVGWLRDKAAVLRGVLDDHPPTLAHCIDAALDAEPRGGSV